MLFILAFSRHDADQAVSVLKWMHELHGKLDADSVAVCAKDVPRNKIGEVYGALSAVFKRACVSTIAEPYENTPSDTENGWPGGCNALFVRTLEELVQPKGLPAQGLPERVKEHDSFYYFEPDCVPVRADWWQVVQAEYAEAVASGKKVLAYVARHRMTGVLTEQYPVGTAVYPRNLYHLSARLREKNWSMPHENKTGRTLPWDIWARNDIMPMVKEASFLLHRHRSFNWCHPNQVGQKAVVHGCKDSSVLDLVRGLKNGVSFDREYTFLHSGDLGDIIYSLPTLKWFHGQTGVKCRLLFSQAGEAGRVRVREPINKAKLDFIKPLLLAQDYIASVDLWNGTDKADVSFFLFRDNRSLHENLAVAQLKHAHAPKEMADSPWLKVDAGAIKSGRVVIARSPRYHNDSFPWRKVIDKYAGRMLFVGLPEEHKAFCRDFGLLLQDIPFRAVGTMLEMAEVIASADLFIGNQSCPYAVAIGLGQKCIQETMLADQNCIFPGAIHFDGANHKDLDLPDLNLSQARPMLPEENSGGVLSSGPDVPVIQPSETMPGLGSSLATVSVGALCDELATRDMQEVLGHLHRNRIIRAKARNKARLKKPGYIKTALGYIPEKGIKCVSMNQKRAYTPVET